MKQTELNLFPQNDGHTASGLTDFLNENAPEPVSLVLTRNRVSMISVEFTGRDCKVRMQEGFLFAPMTVIRALRRYLRQRRRKDWNVVSEFASTIEPVPRKPVLQKDLKTRGEVYDLKEIYRAVNEEHFSGRVKCRIGWSRGRTKRRKRWWRGRHIRFGSWVDSTRTVKVHPVLDDTRVPVEFVKYIVFHEMLHAVVPREVRNGRSYDHSPQFKKLERAYPGFDEMKKISKHILENIL